jgi:uncharacterized protein YbjT (DUF2867 family)
MTMTRKTVFFIWLLTSLTALATLTTGCSAAGSQNRIGQVLVVGATGQTGRLIVSDLQQAGYRVSAFVRDAEKARKLLGDDVQLFTGDVKDAASIAPAMQNADAVISAIGARGAKGPDRPEIIDYLGVKNLADAAASAGVKHFVLLSSMGVTHEDHPLNKMFGNVLVWKGKGEQALRDSGVPYTIVRPGGLVNEAADQGRITLVQGDPRGQVVIPRADVATVCVEALRNPESINKTLETYRVDGEPVTDWAAAFAALARD